MASIEWIEQPDEPSGGCGIACLAMLTGVNYVQLTISAPKFCATCGVAYQDMFDYLAEQGYSLRVVNRVNAATKALRTPWPPKPFADKHLVMLYQTRADFLVGEEEAHYVVMDDKGVVYDPALPEFVKKRLRDYYRVEWVAGVYE